MYGPQRLREGTGRVGNRGTNQNQPDYSVVVIVKNTEEHPVDRRRLAVARLSVKENQLMLLWEICQECNNNDNKNVTLISVVIGARATIPKEFEIRGDHADNSIIKFSKNTVKSPGNLRRLAVTQTPVKNHQPTVVWKTLKGVE